ncbi:MAG: insulinase family protein, partial [Bacteroidetes bacterium]|nr:insulinase family protein [Bacteroidota bacterium]
MSRRLDRQSPPAAAAITYVPLPPVSRHTLSNGIPVYMIRYGTQEVVECQLVFPAGNCYEDITGLAAFTGKLLTEGTTTKTSLQLSQMLDDFGASLSVDTGYELSTLTLSTLERHLPLTLNLLRDVVLNATLPEEEFATELERTRQRLVVEQQKTPYQARVIFGEKIFGPGHPYATHPTSQDLDALSPERCRTYARTYFHPTQATLIVAGLFDEDDTLRLLESKLGNIAPPAEASQRVASRAAAHP